MDFPMGMFPRALGHMTTSAMRDWDLISITTKKHTRALWLRSSTLAPSWISHRVVMMRWLWQGIPFETVSCKNTTESL